MIYEEFMRVMKFMRNIMKQIIYILILGKSNNVIKCTVMYKLVDLYVFLGERVPV